MKRQFDQQQCMGCGNCIQFCPKQLLELSNELNKRGVRTVTIKDEQACIHCGQCELMCTAGAVKIENSGYRGAELINKQKIPPHTGCYLGSLTKALSESIARLKVAQRIVIFKKKTADVNLNVETHDYEDDQFYEDGLAYKRKYPDKIVILICSSSKELSTKKNRERFLALYDEQVTIINTLNWFEANDQMSELTRGGCHVLEEVVAQKRASFVARGSVKTPKQMKQLIDYLEHAIQNQMDGKRFSMVEFVFPCFYRLANRPQILMSCDELLPIKNWFEKMVEKEYQEGSWME